MVNAKKEIVFHERQIAILQMLIDLDNRILRSKQNIKMVIGNDFMNMKSHYQNRISKDEEMKIRIEKYFQNQNLKNYENKKS